VLLAQITTEEEHGVLQYEIIGNKLYCSLPIRQRSVTDLNNPLLIGHQSVTDFTSSLPIGLHL
jgi:hypothetical protein